MSICAGLIQSVSRAFAKIGSHAHPGTRVSPPKSINLFLLLLLFLLFPSLDKNPTNLSRKCANTP